MKKISAAMITGFLLCSILQVQAQDSNEQQLMVLSPYHIAISYSMTTNIIFPYAVIGVDRGSRDVLVQKAKGAENILQLKAGRDSFPETNLSVITADGKLTCFIIDYTKQASELTISFLNEASQNTAAILQSNPNTKEVEHYAWLAAVSKERLKGVQDHAYGIRFLLTGLFIHNGLMYFRISIINTTNVDYDIDQLRFYIRDQKKLKRVAAQEIEIQPVFVYDHTDRVSMNTKHTIVFALPKFTIPDKKYLAIQLMEKNGGRHMKLHIKNRHLLKVVSLK